MIADMISSNQPLLGLPEKSYTAASDFRFAVLCVASHLWRKMHGMIAKGLLEILVCPACKGVLEYRQNPESLKCTQCRRVYAVKDDIPIMLVDEAIIEP